MPSNSPEKKKYFSYRKQQILCRYTLSDYFLKSVLIKFYFIVKENIL